MSKLTVQNAQITTAAVEIKTLTISGKQVTLAVFRQLLEESLIADDGTLNGVPWGMVNYHPGSQCYVAPHAGQASGDSYSGSHLHVVWQRGSELRRSTVRTDMAWSRHFGNALDLFYSTCVVAWLHNELSDRWFGGDPVRRDRYKRLTIWEGKHQGILASAEMCGAAAKAVEARVAMAEAGEAVVRYRNAGGESGGHYAVALEGARKTLAEREHEFVAALVAANTELNVDPDKPDYAALIDARWLDAVAEAQDEIARRKRHADVRQALADLPQLFIAV